MSEDQLKILAALAGSIASLLVAVISFLSTRANQRELETLRADLAEQKAERDALRDYEYEARKRLYHDCGPLFFQLSELASAALGRIFSLARTAAQGNLEWGQSFWLEDEYYRWSTLHRLLAPLAAVRVLQRHLTHIALSLEPVVYRQYVLARQTLSVLSDDFRLAAITPSLQYDPLSPSAEQHFESSPEIYWRQETAVGIVETQKVNNKWCAQKDSNLQPHAYQTCALTGLSYRPLPYTTCCSTIS